MIFAWLLEIALLAGAETQDAQVLLLNSARDLVFNLVTLVNMCKALVGKFVQVCLPSTRESPVVRVCFSPFVFLHLRTQPWT